MSNAKHLELLRSGVEKWNAWRRKHSSVRPNLHEADLRGLTLVRADLRRAKLSRANLRQVNLSHANLNKADLSGANLLGAGMMSTELEGADLRGACLRKAVLVRARLRGANLGGADLSIANIGPADLSRTNLRGADLHGARLSLGTSLQGANLAGANLSNANLANADLTGADLSGCRVYGVAAWRLKLDHRTRQKNLIITRHNEPEITVDNIEIAQFVDLLLHNDKIRDAIDTIGKKGVLLLGRFSGERMGVLERLREELRRRDLLPIVFNFAKPQSKNFTETVRLLAGMSHFVIADITRPKSTPLELQATVPQCMIPFVTIIEHGEKPFSMFKDLWIAHKRWVFPPLVYSSVNQLIRGLDREIIAPAQTRFRELLKEKAEEMPIRRLGRRGVGSIGAR